MTIDRRDMIGGLTNVEEPMRRERVPDPKGKGKAGSNTNIYRRYDIHGREVFEVFHRDNDGKPHYTTVSGGITEARKYRDKIAGRKAQGENVRVNKRLTFGAVAEEWLSGPVLSLGDRTQQSYADNVKNHLHVWNKCKLDSLRANDIEKLMASLKADGLSEWTRAGILNTIRQIFKYAIDRLDYPQVNPVTKISKETRPKPSKTQRRRIFEGTEYEETLAAAQEPFYTMFYLAAVTGGRLSEILGLRFCDLDLESELIRFEQQIDRKGNVTELKTEESQRIVPIFDELVAVLRNHKMRSKRSQPNDFVFATASGRPISQRNTTRALRLAQTKARKADGTPTFPALHENVATRRIIHGDLPSFHAFRHNAASAMIEDGQSIHEVSWQLGHKNSLVTQTVYIRELKNIQQQQRHAQSREHQSVRYGGLSRKNPMPDSNGEVIELRSS